MIHLYIQGYGFRMQMKSMVPRMHSQWDYLTIKVLVKVERSIRRGVAER